MNTPGFARAQELLRRNRDDPGRPKEFTLRGLTWELLDGVFAPVYTPITEIFSGWLPFRPGQRFLEMGCGTGVISVIAALSGCSEVVAADISLAAVENTRRNARRHGVADRLRVLHSDMFDAFSPHESFDMIFWNSNFVQPPDGFRNDTDLHHALFDPHYQAHRKYARQAPQHLSADGRLLLGFSDLGNRALLADISGENGLTIVPVRTERRQLVEISIEFQLLELLPRKPGEA